MDVAIGPKMTFQSESFDVVPARHMIESIHRNRAGELDVSTDMQKIEVDRRRHALRHHHRQAGENSRALDAIDADDSIEPAPKTALSLAADRPRRTPAGSDRRPGYQT